MVRIHTNIHITVSNLYRPSQDAASLQYVTVDNDKTSITDTQDSILTCNVNKYSGTHILMITEGH